MTGKKIEAPEQNKAQKTVGVHKAQVDLDFRGLVAGKTRVLEHGHCRIRSRRAYLGRGLQPECAACREWPGALGTRRNLVHLGCPRISLPEIEVSSARGSPTRTIFSLPENWWPPCRGR
ncbi:glutamate--cysteine ligase catalytic subunit [Striga asiatica]|uniref:Glutamate--cysteine ligase catalytic subunit n=1 Tax=Striga asiatica TaxID=4170 RepID=A0A5A7PS86_STRAF|nr:glutamate--cysteine ligase catalytic subunit [Striga asiatica]